MTTKTKTQVRIIALDHHFEAVPEECASAVLFWVRDREWRTRQYDSLEAAREAAETFRALGGVLEDGAEPVMPSPAAEPDAQHDVAALVGGIISDLQEEAAADLVDAFPRDAAEIEAIGELSDGRYLASGEDGLDVYADGDDSQPYFTIPRGLHPAIARRLIDTWEAGYKRGLANGGEVARRDMRRMLGVAQ